MRLLAVSAVAPWPIEGGFSLRAARLLDQLADEWDISLVVAAGGRPLGTSQEGPLGGQRHRVVRVTPGQALAPVPPAWSGPARRLVERAVAEVAAADRPVAALLWPGTEFLLGSLDPRLPVVCDRCDSATLERVRGLRRSPGTWPRILRYAWYERHLVRRAAATTACGASDARWLSRLGGRPVTVIRNGVAIDSTATIASEAAEPTVAFTGTLDYPPNVDSARFLVERIWPRVRSVVPAARLVLAGRRPSEKVRVLAGRNGVEVRADLPDLRPVLRESWLAVAPMRTGTGVKNKVLESWAVGRPVVMTSVAANGLALEVAGAELVADRPESFAGLVVELLTDPARRHRLGARCQAAARECHRWADAARVLSGLLRQVAGEPR